MLKLKELRKKMGLSQQELANTLCITQATLSGWENEKFEIDNKNLIKLCDIFNVSIDYLLGRSDTNSNILNKRIAELLNDCEDYTPLAQKTGVTVANVIQWVKGVSTNCYDKIPDLADYFNVSTDYLLGKTDEPYLASAQADSLSLTDNEQSLITNYRSLDDDGKGKADKYLIDLAELHKLKTHKIGSLHIITDPDAELTTEDIKEIRNIIEN